jgi:hypothetical protein
LITDLLDGTKTDSMPAQENRRRMLDWWATAIARDSRLAKIFNHLTTKAGFKFPSVLLLPVSTAAAQFQSWLLEEASSVWYLVRSLCSRVEQAAVALVTLVLALCQQGKVTQPAVELAEQAEKAVATSLVATSFAHQLWRRRRTSTLIWEMHRHRQRPRTFERARLHREQSLSGARVGHSQITKSIRRCESREQSTMSGVASSRHARACTARLLA